MVTNQVLHSLYNFHLFGFTDFKLEIESQGLCSLYYIDMDQNVKNQFSCAFRFWEPEAIFCSKTTLSNIILDLYQ